MQIKWNGDVGPAAIGIILQTLIIGAGGIVAVSNLNNNVANTKATTDKLEAIVKSQGDNAAHTGERIAGVEATLTALTSTVSRIDLKIDALKK